MNPLEDIPVYPNITKTTKIVKMQIEVMEIKLFEYITLQVVFFTEEGNPIDVKIMKIDKTNGYNDWGNDDNFILEWVKKELAIGKYS